MTRYEFVESLIGYIQSERANGNRFALTQRERWLIEFVVDQTLQNGPTTYIYHVVEATQRRIECMELCGGHPEHHLSEYRALDVKS